uniref:Uncharacterized protein n=1 Tax=Chromera velia CCMP2878 TaxID=1169474 RepID=A0A0G4FX82_9ALVE|eukprot:Cvel_19224.t1-p1 / transcript=Cvel_19224.t1 / gene=Cvel_19224 / organism=Chromera_velia_CCMP2878 / gene_product=hypothetical protein / transcript_product=hypothetical protein / location=Cvel_scaffold1642:25588-31686(-) / protein_length=211 / sequence_SO=supercontig / SO=protein_coding / is_pseudo=false
MQGVKVDAKIVCDKYQGYSFNMSKEDPAFLQSMFKALERPLGKADKQQEVYTKLREAVGVKNTESVREFDLENPDDRSLVGLSDRSQARAVARCLQFLVPALQAPTAINNNAPPISKGENPVFAKAKAATGPFPSSAPPSAVASPLEKAPSSAATAPQHPRPWKRWRREVLPRPRSHVLHGPRSSVRLWLCCGISGRVHREIQSGSGRGGV